MGSKNVTHVSQSLGRGKVCKCCLCSVYDYCLDYSNKFYKDEPLYICKFCYNSLLKDKAGILHKLHGLPFLKKNVF